jgi:HAD superfamily hydrolase (TIGR01509 family)
MIKLIIFDMDGLMIDSEPFHCMAYGEVLRQFGKQLSLEYNNKHYVGKGDMFAGQDIVKRLSLPISAEELNSRKQAVYKKLIASEIIPQEGLVELLKKLHKNNYRKAVASGSTLDEIRIIIDGLNISKYIESYFSAQQVKNGKPAPDLFLLTANEMGVDPSECLVLEDAPSGVAAAKAAGMKCFVVPSRETKQEDFSNATLVLNSLTEVFDNIEKYISL